MAKLAAEQQTAAALKQVTELMARLAEVKKLPCIEEEWFASWKETKDCEVFCNQVGSAAQKMGEDDALGLMKKALAKSHPSFAWDEAMASYKALADAEDQALLTELNIGLSDDDLGEAEEEHPSTAVAGSEELTGSTNEPPTDPPAV